MPFYGCDLGRSQFRKQLGSPIVPSSLLELIRCHQTDEYPVFGSEDEGPVPPLACSFCKVQSSAHVLALVDENGSLVTYNTNKTGEDSLIEDWQAHSNAVFDVAWMSREEKLLTASGDQTVCLWDVQTVEKLLTFKGHTSSVRSVEFRHQDDAVFATGSRDGHVRLWDVRCNVKGNQASSVNMIKNAHTVPLTDTNKRRKFRGAGPGQTQDSQQSVTSVLFQDQDLLVTAGAVDGCVKVFDLRKNYTIATSESVALYRFPYTGCSKRTHGYSSLAFDSHFSRLFASCTDDIIYCYDFASYNPEPVCTFRGHRNTSFYVRAVVSPDNQFLLSGSSDENAYIWKVDKPNESPVILKGHRSEISDVAWCHKDLFRIVTTSDDNTMRVWRFDPTAEMRKSKGQSDISCDITGTAERTHRDIGVLAESSLTSKTATSSAKRAAASPVPCNITPKRSKTLPLAATSTVSPSIKDWFKRSASEPLAISDKTDTGAKKIKLCLNTSPSTICVKTEPGQATEIKDIVAKTTKSVVESDSISSTAGVPKNELRGEQDSGNDKENDGKERAERVGKHSCKRKLVSDENSPEKLTKRRKQSQSTILENSDNKNVENVMKQGENIQTKTSMSPVKREAVLADLDSAINASPEKHQGVGVEFYSPARPRVLDMDKKTLYSPTADLPNLVYDSPKSLHLADARTPKSEKKTVDWLTQMRIQKLAKFSPKTRSCKGKLLDKLAPISEKAVAATSTDAMSQDKNCSSPARTGGVNQSTNIMSPVPGVKIITSYFQRQNTQS